MWLIEYFIITSHKQIGMASFEFFAAIFNGAWLFDTQVILDDWPDYYLETGTMDNNHNCLNDAAQKETDGWP